MNNQIFCDNLLSTAKLMDVNSELSVETEIVLADYDAPVFKIVKSTMEHLVTQKYVSAGKLTVEGFIKVSIYYQPPAGEKLSVVFKKIPFQKQLDIGDNELDLSYIDVTGQTQYINTRPQSSTRIDVRGAYLLGIKYMGAKENNIITAISNKDVCVDNATIDFFSLTGQNIRQFNIEDEIDLGEDFYKIVRVEHFAQTPEIAVHTDKVVVKGEILANIFYTSNSADDIKQFTKSFMYNQIVDVPKVKENDFVHSNINVSSFGIAQNQDTKKFVANVSVMIDLRVFSKSQIIAVKDAFSREYETETKIDTVLVDTNIYNIEKNIPLQINEKIGKEYIVSTMFFEISPVKNYFEINKNIVKAKLTVNIIARNVQNEYECFVNTQDIVLDFLENCRQYDEICIDLKSVGYSAIQNEDTVQINANIAASGIVIEKSPITLLNSFEENADKQVAQEQDELIIYYGKKGEKVFDIAKNHLANPQFIMEENELQTDRLTANQMLFIPCYRD